MKRFVLLTLLFLASATVLRAQSEVNTDTLVLSPSTETVLPSTVKNYGGFLLDMNLTSQTERPSLSSFKLEVPDASKDYNWIFRLDPNVTYSSGLSNMFSLSGSPYFSSNPFGIMGFGFGNTTDNLQMGSFRLKNGWRLNTYGEYDKDGWRVPNPSALPWQKNNFKGAFELKSQNGSFGIRIEVQKGRENPFFY